MRRAFLCTGPFFFFFSFNQLKKCQKIVLKKPIRVSTDAKTPKYFGVFCLLKVLKDMEEPQKIKPHDSDLKIND